MSRILVGQHQNKTKKRKKKELAAERRQFRLRRVCATVLNSWCKLQALLAWWACVNLTRNCARYVISALRTFVSEARGLHAMRGLRTQTL